MTEMSKIEIPVEAETALALTDPRRLAAIGRLVDLLVQPSEEDPLIALFKRTSAEAAIAGLTQDDIDAELAAYKAERRS